MNLFEAFRALDALNEDTFSVSDDGIKKLSDFQNDDDLTDEVSVIDPEAETEEDLQDSYVGKVILDCSVCHSKLYKDKEEVEINEEEDLANVGDECPYCYSVDGFKVIGEVAPFGDEAESTEDEEVEETSEEETEVEEDSDEEKNESLNEALSEDLGEDIEKYQDWVDYDMKRYGKISEQTNKEISEAGLKIVKDKYGDYEVISGDPTNESWKSYVKNRKRKVNEDDSNVEDNLNEKIEYDTSDASIIILYDKKAKTWSGEIADWAISVDNAKSKNEAFIKLKDLVNKELENEPKYKFGKLELDDEDEDSQTYIAEIYEPFEESLSEDKLEEGIFDKFKKDKTVYTIWQEKDGQTRPLISVEGEKEAKKSIQEYENNHGSDYAKQHGIKYTYEVQDIDKENKAKAEYRKYHQSLGESINNLSLDTEDTHMEMTSDDTGKVTITTEPVENQELAGEEVITPLSDETEAEIEANSTDDEEIIEEEPIESEETSEEEIDMEVDEFDEESFDETNESYLKSMYENVESYKTTKVSSDANKLFVEGLIKFTSGNTKKTSFILESKELTKEGKASFSIKNKELTENYNNNLIGNIKDNKFITEELN